MTVTENRSVAETQQKSQSVRSIWYYLLLGSFGLWVLGLFVGLAYDVFGSFFLLNYISMIPLLAIMLYMDRRRVCATGTNRAYVESALLLDSWVLGRSTAESLVRLTLISVIYLTQLPLLVLVPWYVAVVRRRAYRSEDPATGTKPGVRGQGDASESEASSRSDSTSQQSDVLTLTAERTRESAGSDASSTSATGSATHANTATPEPTTEPKATESPGEPESTRRTTDSPGEPETTEPAPTPATESKTTTIDAAATRARGLASEGDRHAEAGEYTDAQDAYERAREEYRRAVDIAQERRSEGADYVNVEWFETEIERVDERIEACVVARFEDRLDEAERLLAADEPERAESAFADLVVELGTLDVASDRVASLRNTAQNGHLRAWIDRAREEVNEADALFDREEFAEAKSTYEAALTRVDAVRSTAHEYGIDALDDEVDGLVDHCRERIEACENSLSTDPPLAIEDFVRAELPEYELVRQLGGGGNADVYELRHTGSDERVALKVPRWRFNRTLLTKDVERFVREAETWERVDTHPNIVDVLDYGKLPFPWMLLELMDGSLRERFEPMDLRTRVDVLIDVASALEYAHGHATVHLDIKPENILLDASGTPKVADWGLARVVFEITKSQFGLTPAYSAPEQIRGRTEDLDRQTDVYQFGALAYEILTGHLPFDAAGSFDLAQQILTEPPAPPSSVNPALPTTLDEPILKALSKEKSDRYEAIIQFRDTLRELRDEVPAA